jgi:orotate phosphoribosyltransferase
LGDEWLLSVLAEGTILASADKRRPASVERAVLRAVLCSFSANEGRAHEGRRVLVVDDIVNTGLSIRQTIDAAVEAGAKVVAAAAICSRGNAGAEEIGCDFLYLTEVKIPLWPADKCHLCRDGVPVNVHYAHGMEFVRASGATA